MIEISGVISARGVLGGNGAASSQGGGGGGGGGSGGAIWLQAEDIRGAGTIDVSGAAGGSQGDGSYSGGAGGAGAPGRARMDASRVAFTGTAPAALTRTTVPSVSGVFSL
jgi:hypothetical protein